MNRGYIKLYRKTIESPIFTHDAMFKLFILCMLKATHKKTSVRIPGILKPIELEPGQFVTGRHSLWEDYHQLHLRKKPRRKPLPSAKTVFRWLLTLQSMSILSIKSYNKYSIISVLNWKQYQQDVQQMSISCPSGVHIQEGFKNNKETPDLFFLKERYSDQDLIDRVFQAIASVRKNGKVVDSVLLAQLKKWDRYPVAQVEAGILAYLDKDYAGQGRNENYLMGIIRNQENTKQKKESTGSSLLDKYYADAS